MKKNSTNKSYLFTDFYFQIAVDLFNKIQKAYEGNFFNSPLGHFLTDFILDNLNPLPLPIS